MKNAYKIHLPNGKSKIIDEKDFISIAKDKMMHNNILKKKFHNKEINITCGYDIFKYLKVKVEAIDAILVDIPKEVNSCFKTISMLENDISKFIFDPDNVDNKECDLYLNGSKDSMLKILEEGLSYVVAKTEKRTLKGFIDKEVYFTSELQYKNNDITIELSSSRFAVDRNTNYIYKYKASIIDEDGYKFNFKKDELFTTRQKALIEAKKLIDEHYKLPIKYNKIQKIIVRTDSKNTIIVFWPDHKTDKNYILSNDIIAGSDLGGETKTSMAFFENCKEATAKEIELAKSVILKCFNLITFPIKNIYKS